MGSNKKSHFKAPSPTQVRMSSGQYPACSGAQMPRPSCRGYWRPCLPWRQAGWKEGSNWPQGSRDRKSRWEVLAHDYLWEVERRRCPDSGQGLSPYLWMLSGME